MELDNRVSILETEMRAVKTDIADIKVQLNDTAKRSDVQDLKATLDARDQNYTRNLWRLVFALIIVFTGILIASLGLKVTDLPATLF